jgi:DNA-binding XRE family transcriptional regulator
MADDTRTRVERLVRADPRLSAADMARAVGVSRQRAHQILAELGYRQEWRKPVRASRSHHPQ